MTSALPPPSAAKPRPSVRRRRLLLFAVVLLVLSAAAWGGWRWYQRAPLRAPPDPDLDGVDKAIAALITKERKAVLAAPRDAAAWGRLGEVLEVFNYRKDAVFCFAEAERLDPNQPRWPYHQGILLLLENSEEAILRLRRAVELSGDDTGILRLRLSEALLAQGRLDEAEDGFRRLLQHDTGHPRAHLGMGRVAMQRQQWKEALPHLQLAAADKRTIRAANLALAELYENLDDETAAAQARARIANLAVDPPWPDPFVEEILRFNTGKRARLMQADKLFKQGSKKEAISEYGKVVQDYPTSEEAWGQLGQALYWAGDYANAERVLKKAVEIEPRYAEAHNYLGLAQLAQDNLEEAATSFRKAIDAKPDFALAYSSLSRCLLRQNNVSAALDACRSAVRYKPDYAAMRTALAELLHQTHQDAEALEEVRIALQLNPHDERAKQLRQTLEAKLKKKE